ncbi:hypothetical protein D3C87_1868170 [compost metagenome]
MIDVESAFNNFVGCFCVLRSSFRTDDEKSEASVHWMVLFTIACRSVLDTDVLFGERQWMTEEGGRRAVDFWTLNDRVSVRNAQNRGAF